VAVEEDGPVYKAIHFGLNQPVHVKVLAPDLASDPDMAQRFIRQAQLAVTVSHPLIPRILDVSTNRDSLWIVREPAEGQRLSAQLNGSPLSAAEVNATFPKITEALAAVHDAGLLHLNMKPHSIILSPDKKNVRLVGFAAAIHKSEQLQVIAGSPGYAPNEQAVSRELDPSTDIFALGLLLYEMLTGRPAFPAEKDSALFALPDEIQVPAPSAVIPSVPKHLAELVRRMTQPLTKDRIASCSAVLADLAAEPQPEPDADLTVIELPPPVAPPAKEEATPLPEPPAAPGPQEQEEFEVISEQPEFEVVSEQPEFEVISQQSDLEEIPQPGAQANAPPTQAAPASPDPIIEVVELGPPQGSPEPTGQPQSPKPKAPQPSSDGHDVDAGVEVISAPPVQAPSADNVAVEIVEVAPSETPSESGVVRPKKGKATAKAASETAAPLPAAPAADAVGKKKKLLVFAAAGGGGLIAVVIVLVLMFSNGEPEEPAPKKAPPRTAQATPPNKPKAVPAQKKPEATKAEPAKAEAKKPPNGETKTSNPLPKKTDGTAKAVPESPPEKKTEAAPPALVADDKEAIQAAFNKAQTAAEARAEKQHFAEALKKLDEFIQAHPKGDAAEQAKSRQADIRKQAEDAFQAIQKKAEKLLGEHDYPPAFKAYENVLRIWGMPEHKQAAERAIMEAKRRHELYIVSEAGKLWNKINKHISTGDFDSARFDCEDALEVARDPMLKQWIAGTKTDVARSGELRQIVLQGVNTIKGQKMQVQQGSMKVMVRILGANQSGILYQGVRDQVTIEWAALNPMQVYKFGKQFGNPDNARHRLAIGTYCLDNGLVEEGIGEFSAAARIDPKTKEALAERLRRAGTGTALVPAGPFKAGSNEGAANEKPGHEANVGPFFIGRYEVTNAEYQYFVTETQHRRPEHWPKGVCPKGSGNMPVTNIVWEDACAYARWLGWRLPEEMEWEKAARGTDGREYPWGSGFSTTKANALKPPEKTKTTGSPETTKATKKATDKQEPQAHPKHIRSYTNGASPFGLFDVCGNVAEWTASWYKPYKGNSDADPDKGDAEKDTDYGEKHKVIRGGACIDTADKATCTYRDHKPPTEKNAYLGFRCVWGPIPPPLAEPEKAPKE